MLPALEGHPRAIGKLSLERCVVGLHPLRQVLEDEADGLELGGRKSGYPLLEPLAVSCDDRLRFEAEVMRDAGE
jgi:hypothetical protein